MTTDAIQKDVLKNDDGETIGTYNPRNSMIDAIANKNLERMQEEMLENGITPDQVSAGDDVEVKTEAKTEEKPQAETPAMQLVDESQLTTLMVKAKINGNEETVPLAEVVKSYQKDSSASKRLEQASLRLQEVERREKDIAEREAKLKDIQQINEAKPAADDVDAVLDEAVSAIYEGDETKTKDSLRKLVTQAGRNDATQASTTLDVSQIASEVKETITREAALEKFGNDFKDVVKDPVLRSIADTYLDAELQDGKPFAQALESAGALTREWVKEQANAVLGVTVTQTDKDSKLASKQALDNVRSANSRVPADNAGEPTETVSSVVAEMRKARGQPT